MRVNVRLSRKITGRDECYSRAARLLSELAIFANREALSRDKSIPKLYSSGVVYRIENQENGEPDELVDVYTILERGWGDCLHLANWRIAELREAGENASPRFVWRRLVHKGKKIRLFHVLVRRGNGTIEDPSRKLGM